MPPLETELPDLGASPAPETPNAESEPSGAKRSHQRKGSAAGDSSTSSTSRGRGRPSNAERSSTLDRELRQLQVDLQTQLMGMGAMLSMIRPTTGAVMISRAERATTALCDIASKNERVLRALRAWLAFFAYEELAQTGLELFVATGVDRGAVAPDSLVTFTIRDQIPQEIYERWAEARAQDAATAAAQNGATGQPAAV
jgi:hypothetical protein